MSKGRHLRSTYLTSETGKQFQKWFADAKKAGFSDADAKRWCLYNLDSKFNGWQTGGIPTKRCYAYRKEDPKLYDKLVANVREQQSLSRAWYTHLKRTFYMCSTLTHLDPDYLVPDVRSFFFYRGPDWNVSFKEENKEAFSKEVFRQYEQYKKDGSVSAATLLRIALA